MKNLADGQQQAESSRQSKTSRPLTSIPAPAAKINVPLDVMSENFEEWMKMAMDGVCTRYIPRKLLAKPGPFRK